MTKRLFLLLFTLNITSSILSARSIETINAKKAQEVAREQVIWNERLCPFSTAALDFLEDIYGKSTYKRLTPEQVVYGWLLRPEVWKEEPMIMITDKDLRQQLGIEEEYAKFSELFDDTLGYKLNSLGADLPENMRQIIRQSPAVIDLDEKVGMIILLTKGQLIKPRSSDMEPLPKWRVETEILWNHYSLWIILLSMFLFALIVFEIQKIRKK